MKDRAGGKMKESYIKVPGAPGGAFMRGRADGRPRMAYREWVLKMLVFGAFITVCLTAGFYICSPLMSKLPPVVGYWIAVWIGLLSFSLAGMLVHKIARRNMPERHERQHGIIIDALERISKGDFNVFVESDDHIHDEFTGLINDMAKNLGTLETMRQEFISNVSHEIQSPLTSIGGFAELLQNPALPMDERLRYAKIIRAESKRLSSLSDNLLKLSSLDNDPLSLAEFRLDKQLSNVILTLEPQWAERNILLEADLPQCTTRADEGLLSQVWVNLLHNAVKFTPEGDSVSVKLESDGGGATVTITDNGVGIGKEDLPHIFERFYKADKARDRSLGGNGLGLSLVKKIVELHGGQISVESELGKGARFTVSLP
ncbi:MAG: HAMP domain-containing histidine kinase [Clostridiales Family XIII bacterium]|jgi:signal transduction histidine kinase|nr:HAMP domain-containing histidine kinase [Clostridiales Family XIII bacterium]